MGRQISAQCSFKGTNSIILMTSSTLITSPNLIFKHHRLGYQGFNIGILFVCVWGGVSNSVHSIQVLKCVFVIYYCIIKRLYFKNNLLFSFLCCSLSVCKLTGLISLCSGSQTILCLSLISRLATGFTSSFVQGQLHLILWGLSLISYLQYFTKESPLDVLQASQV